MGLPADLRLRKPSDFTETLRNGEKAGDRLLLVSAVRTDRGHMRIGLAVNKRVGGAVVRNRVKRRLREAFRELSGAAEGGWDIVASARPAAAEADFNDLRLSAARLAARVGVVPGRDERAASSGRKGRG